MFCQRQLPNAYVTRQSSQDRDLQVNQGKSIVSHRETKTAIQTPPTAPPTGEIAGVS